MSQKKVTRSVATIGLMVAALFVIAACVPETPPTDPGSTSTTSSTTTSTTSSTTTSTTTSTIPVGNGPVANLTALQPTTGGTPLAVKYSVAGSQWDTSDPANCRVDLGDGRQPGTCAGNFLTNVYGHYTGLSTYTATLTVKGENGATATDTVTITPSGVAPALNSAPQITPNPIPVTAGQTAAQVSVRFTGPADVMMVAEVCKKSISDLTFDISEDCAPYSRVTPNGTSTGSQALVYEIFRGDNPDGETPWGCYAPGDTAPAGYEKFTTCYVRVTNNFLFNMTDDSETAFSFVNA